MKKITLFILIISFLITGCSQKNKYPVQLEDGSFQVIHKNLITKHKNIIQKDTSMSKIDWFYKLHFKKEKNYFVKNYKVVKTFYLLHHANYILIKGNKKCIKEYRTYFINNGVNAKISLKIVKHKHNEVTVLLSHNKQILKETK